MMDHCNLYHLMNKCLMMGQNYLPKVIVIYETKAYLHCPSVSKRHRMRERLCRPFSQPKAVGLAALLNGKLMAYLVGCPAVNAIQGRHVWIHPAGIGIDLSCSLWEVFG